MSENYKLAYLFITKHNLNQYDLWERYWSAYQKYYNIYVHPKEPNNVTNELLKSRIIDDLHETDYEHIVSALLALFKAAYADKSNKKFILLSESCAPIKSFPATYNFLKRSNNSYVDIWKIKRWDTDNRLNISIPYPRDKIIKTSSWFILDRRHVKLLLDNNAKQHYDYFKSIAVGNEFMLSLIFGLHPEELKYNISYPMTYVNWKYTDDKYQYYKQQYYKINDGPDYAYKRNDLAIIKDLQAKTATHPKTYDHITPTDYNELYNSGALFARKFTQSSDVIIHYHNLAKSPIRGNRK